MNDKAREAFEAFAKTKGTPEQGWWFRQLDDGGYSAGGPDAGWETWQAALQWAASQQPDAKAWAVLNEDGDVSMAFLDRAEALTYCGEGEQPVPMVFGGAASQQAAGVMAWAHEDDPARVISDGQKQQAIRDGGASASSVRPYSIALSVAAPTQQAAEGWISVHERLPALPEDCEDDGVKVYTWDGEFVTEDVFEPQYEQPAGPAVGGWLRTGDWFCSDTASRVTHWMPRKLPAAPTAQGERDV